MHTQYHQQKRLCSCCNTVSTMQASISSFVVYNKYCCVAPLACSVDMMRLCKNSAWCWHADIVFFLTFFVYLLYTVYSKIACRYSITSNQNIFHVIFPQEWLDTCLWFVAIYERLKWTFKNEFYWWILFYDVLHVQLNEKLQKHLQYDVNSCCKFTALFGKNIKHSATH